MVGTFENMIHNTRTGINTFLLQDQAHGNMATRGFRKLAKAILPAPVDYAALREAQIQMRLAAAQSLSQTPIPSADGIVDFSRAVSRAVTALSLPEATRAQLFAKNMDCVDTLATVDRQAAFNVLCNTSIYGNPASQERANQKLALISDFKTGNWPTDTIVQSTPQLSKPVGLGHPFQYGRGWSAGVK